MREVSRQEVQDLMARGAQVVDVLPAEEYQDDHLWLAAGLPTEGRNANQPRAGDVARRDVPTCRLEESIGQVQERVRAPDGRPAWS